MYMKNFQWNIMFLCKQLRLNCLYKHDFQAESSREGTFCVSLLLLRVSNGNVKFADTRWHFVWPLPNRAVCSAVGQKQWEEGL